ncbi:MAG: hypothetical protein CL938_03835 [Deltaproteobacteria bacterium]|nr:hypothetical protein [Deltaproteobacteria bacterium]
MGALAWDRSGEWYSRPIHPSRVSNSPTKVLVSTGSGEEIVVRVVVDRELCEANAICRAWCLELQAKCLEGPSGSRIDHSRKTQHAGERAVGGSEKPISPFAIDMQSAYKERRERSDDPGIQIRRVFPPSRSLPIMSRDETAAPRYLIPQVDTGDRALLEQAGVLQRRWPHLQASKVVCAIRLRAGCRVPHGVLT